MLKSATRLSSTTEEGQGELTAQVQTQIGAMEKRVVETLPSAVSAAVPTQALAEEAEKKADAEEAAPARASSRTSSKSPDDTVTMQSGASFLGGAPIFRCVSRLGGGWDYSAW